MSINFNKENAKAYFETCLQKCNLSLDSHKIQNFLYYLEDILLFKKGLGLSGHTTVEEILRKDFIDSILPFLLYPFPKAGFLMDIGSGAGLPGIPLKIVFPEMKVTLLESNTKKCSFLEMIKTHLKQNGIEILCAHTEKLLKQEEYKEKFSIVTSRAFANLEKFIPIGFFFLKKKGLLVAYKGKSVGKEVDNSFKVLEAQKGKVIKIIQFFLPNGNEKRAVVIVEKM